MTDRKIIFKSCTVAEFLAIPEATFKAAMKEARDKREAAEDAYWEKFGELVEECPIVNPHTILRHRARHQLDEIHPADSAPPAEPQNK
jgi:hypothetical protein